MGSRHTYAGLRDTNFVLIRTPGDGSCLFHAVCHAIYTSYLTESIRDIPMSRRSIVLQLRDELAAELDSPNPFDPEGRTYYESISGGEFAALGRSMPEEFGLERLQRLLRSNEWAPEAIVVFLGLRLQKTIYLIDSTTNDMYMMAGLPDPSLPAIVLYYTRESHYDLMGIGEIDGSITTHLAPRHPVAVALYERLVWLKEQARLTSGHKA